MINKDIMDNNIVTMFKEKGIRVTPQRLAVYNILCKGRNHLTADDIYEKIKLQLPAVSLATVYTVLELLKEKELVREIRISFDRSQFEARIDSHHHFMCRDCKKIFDIDIHPCPTLEKREIDGHKIEELQGYFYGLCKECRKKNE
jgi:Fe2+ or Zn2+ uptake regulation protein